jgi:stress-induced morphogen
MSISDRVKQRLTESLSPTLLDIEDESRSGCGDMLRVFIVSEAFEGKSLLERQKMVHQALAVEMADLHALSFKKTWTPSEYESKKHLLTKS